MAVKRAAIIPYESAFDRPPGFGWSLCLIQGLVDEHLQVSLIAQAMAFCLHASFRDVFGVEPNCGGRCRSLACNGPAPKSSRGSRLFKFAGQGVLVFIPPLWRRLVLLTYIQCSYEASVITRMQRDIFAPSGAQP